MRTFVNNFCWIRSDQNIIFVLLLMINFILLKFSGFSSTYFIRKINNTFSNNFEYLEAKKRHDFLYRVLVTSVIIMGKVEWKIVFEYSHVISFTNKRISIIVNVFRLVSRQTL